MKTGLPIKVQFTLWKESFKQWWLSIPPISTKQTISYHLNWLTEHKKTMTTTYYIGNPGPGLVQAQKCGGVKPVNGNATLPSW
jgi:hypothetical protein